MDQQQLLKKITAKFSGVSEIPYPIAPANLPAHEGKPFRDAHLYVLCSAADWASLAQFLKEDSELSFDFLTMVTAVDFIKDNPHFEVVYHLYSMQHQHRLVVKINQPRESALIPSVTHLWPTADWQEREVYDMYGIRFENHPNPTRILMWEGFPGWPMRKDYVHVPDTYDD